MRKNKQYADLALKLGATHAVVTKARDVVVDARALLKCQFGCEGYWKNWTCPSVPGSLRPWEFERILRGYKWALLIHCKDKPTSQRISYEIERRAFMDGKYFAFSMSDCGVCKDCARPRSCKNRRMARPAMQGLGIDVFATARNEATTRRTEPLEVGHTRPA